MKLRVWRAGESDQDAAYAMVGEYNEAIGVMNRDSPESFLRDYFVPGAGLWLAERDGVLAGCIALRRLASIESAGEIKRLYVRPEARGCGVADALLAALEQHAALAGYRWLYLDSKDDLVPALRFYRRHGYTTCERYNDNGQATVFLRKPVTPAAGAGAPPPPAVPR